MDQNQNPSSTVWYVIAAIAIIAGIAYWFYSATPVASPAATTQTPSTNTTAAIGLSLDQIPDNSATLDQDAAASAASVQSF